MNNWKVNKDQHYLREGTEENGSFNALTLHCVEIIVKKFSKKEEKVNLQRSILLIDTPCKHINFYWYQFCVYSVVVTCSSTRMEFGCVCFEVSYIEGIYTRIFLDISWNVHILGKVSFQMKRSLSPKKSKKQRYIRVWLIKTIYLNIADGK